MKEQLKTFLKKLGLYHQLQSNYRRALSSFNRLQNKWAYDKYKGSGFICNFCEATYQKFVPHYPGPDIAEAINSNKVIAGYGENVICPNCMSKSRERLVKVALDNFVNVENKEVLHFSPEKKVYRHIKNKARVTTVDIEPAFYKTVDPSIQFADATKLDFADSRFDIIIANHILEHIPDDIKAMKEMFRVLNENGVAILQVPWSQSLSTTIEDPGINNPAKQCRLYGQKDHVRIYTLDNYTTRLMSAGFRVKVITPTELIPFQKHALQLNEPLVLGYKSSLS